jgi:hypothetical protein
MFLHRSAARKVMHSLASTRSVLVSTRTNLDSPSLLPPLPLLHVDGSCSEKQQDHQQQQQRQRQGQLYILARALYRPHTGRNECRDR